MQLKKLLTLTLAGALIVGTVATSSAAELDFAWYAAKNPDVVAAFGNTPEMLKLHYETYGRKEARMANSHDAEAQLRKLFNPTEYGKLYPDVQAAFGENAEAMFQHYIAFGLLESRRPSEKVSKATAANLKKAVEKAMASAGLVAAPGSAELVAIITGEIQTSVADVAAQQVLTQVASVVEKAVTETVQAVNHPSSGGGGGSSKSSSSDNANTSSSQQITLKNQDLSGKISADAEVVKITSANFKDYFELEGEGAPKVKDEVTLYENYPTKITDDKLDEYVTVSNEASVALKDNTAAYYELDGGTELSEQNIETYFKVDDAGNVTLQDTADIYDEDGKKIESADDYATGTAASVALDSEKGGLFVKEKDAKPTKVTAVDTYFEVKNGEAALKTEKDGATFYSDEDGTTSVEFNDYLTVTPASMEVAEDNPKVYQFEPVEGNVLDYFGVNADNSDALKRSTTGTGKVIATGSEGNYTVDEESNVANSAIAEVIAANKAKVTDKPMYKYDADADTATLLKNNDLTESVVTVDGTTVTIASDVTLYAGEITKLVNATVNSKIGDYLNIPAGK